MYAELDTSHVAASIAALWGDDDLLADVEAPALHISQVHPAMRSAAYLAVANLQDDFYHDNIVTGAHTILAHHCNGECTGDKWLYRTQYASGATLWQCADGSAIVYLGE